MALTLLEPAPPVGVTVPPESFPSLEIGTATTALVASLVRKKIAFADEGGENGRGVATWASHVASSRALGLLKCMMEGGIWTLSWE